MKDRRKNRKILFVLPTHFASRNILTSNVPGIIAAAGRFKVVFASPYEEDHETVARLGLPSCTWSHLKRPVVLGAGGSVGLSVYLRSLCYTVVHALLLGRAGHGQVLFRFNEIQGFFGHRLRKSLVKWYDFDLFSKKRLANKLNAKRYADPKLG